MKKFIFLILIIFLTGINTSNGHNPTYNLFLENFVPNGDYYTANEVTFDITIQGLNNSRVFEYTGGHFTIYFNSGVANGGTLSCSFAGPDTSDLPVNLRPGSPQIDSVTGNSQIVLSQNVFPSPGNGFILPNDQRVKIAKIKLSTTANTFYMNGGPLGGTWIIAMDPQWRNPPLNGNTNIYANVNGDSAVNVTTIFRHDVRDIGLWVNPVELIGFTSSVTNNTVLLNWSTASETNNSGFDIERSSQDSEWNKIGFVNGNGTTNEIRNYTYSDVVNTGAYSYRLKQVDYNGNFEYFNLTNSVEISVPQRFELSQNYPNPFNPSTKINYTIPENEFVSLKIYDINGKVVSTLVNEFQPAGYYEVNFNSSDLSSGVYFYTLSLDILKDTKRMVLVR